MFAAVLAALVAASCVYSIAIPAPTPTLSPYCSMERAPASSAPAQFTWLQSTIGAVIAHDIAFCNASLVFAVGELGVILRSDDGGDTWTSVQSLGYPSYFYGVQCVGTDLIIVGFDDRSTNQSLVVWSSNYGKTLSAPLSIYEGWLSGVEFADSKHGIISILQTTRNFSGVIYTSTGGKTASDWVNVPLGTPSQDGEVYGDFFYNAAGEFASSGTSFCTTKTFPKDIKCNSNVPDNDLDGGVAWFPSTGVAYIGGGVIMPSVCGFVHSTRDGGNTWTISLESQFPIRGVYFASPTVGVAFGGNAVGGSPGGVFATTDGGSTWTLEFPTKGVELSKYTVQVVNGEAVVYVVGFSLAESYIFKSNLGKVVS